MIAGRKVTNSRHKDTVDPGLRFFILGEDGRTPVEAGFDEWIAWANSVGGIVVPVAQEHVDGHYVSTVFISKLVSSHDRVPWYFETFMDDGSKSAIMDRYATWEEAEAGHAAVLAMAPGVRHEF